MKNKYTAITVYSLAHFLVDFSCAFLLLHYLQASSQFYFYLLLYNFCAFALQMPMGLLADRLNKNALLAAMGCVMVFATYLFYGLPLGAVLLAGIGNGLFHIGGGIEILNISTEKASPLGVFVSPGAFGIYLGTAWSWTNSFTHLIAMTALAATAAVILFASFQKEKHFSSDNVPVSFHGISRWGVLCALACLFLVVCLRSYAGLSLSFPWKGEQSWGIFLISAVVLGKAAGGFLSDGIGAKRAAVLSLGLAAILFLFSSAPIAGILAVFLFNMTMPITLWAVARHMKGSKGFSFGLLTFGLFLGYLPAYYQMQPLFSSSVSLGFAAVSLLSLALLLAGLRQNNSEKKDVI